MEEKIISNTDTTKHTGSTLLPTYITLQTEASEGGDEENLISNTDTTKHTGSTILPQCLKGDASDRSRARPLA